MASHAVNVKRLIELREKQKLSQSQLSKLVGCSKPTMQRAEKGENLSPGIIKKIAKVLKVSVDELIVIPDPEREELKSYLEKMCELHGRIKFLGIHIASDAKPHLKGPDNHPDMESLYVEPYIATTRRAPDETPETWNGVPSATSALTESNRPFMIVFGDPGAGKSTLLSHIAYELSQTYPTPLSRAFGNRFPLLFILRELGIGPGMTFDQLLEKYHQNVCRSTVSLHRLKELIQSGRAILLFDGLDELGLEARKSLRRALWTNRFLNYGETTKNLANDEPPSMTKKGAKRVHKTPQVESLCIATSRVIGYDEVPYEINPDVELNDQLHRDVAHALACPRKFETGMHDEVEYQERQIKLSTNATRLFLLPFDDQQIHQFNSNWHAWYHHSANDANAASEAADDFWKDLCLNPQTKILGRIPNVLTIMVNVHQRLGILPDGRARLFSLLTEAYLQGIDEQRKLARLTHPRSTLAEQRLWLSWIAWNVQARRAENEKRDSEERLDEEQVLLFTHREMVEWIAQEQIYTTGNEPDEEEIEGFAQAMQKRAGLIIERGERLYAFVHLTLMEYYAACALIQLSRDPEAGKRTDILLANISAEPIWHEIIQLAFEEITQFHPTDRRIVLKTIFPHLADSLGVEDVLTGKPGTSSFAPESLPVAAGKRPDRFTSDEEWSESLLLLTRLSEDRWAGFDRLKAAIRHTSRCWALRVDPVNGGRWWRENRFIDRWLGEMDDREDADGGHPVRFWVNTLKLKDHCGESLNLRGYVIGDAGARAIAEQLTNLTSLDLSFNQIGDAGARAIAEQLTNLTSLDLSYNQIGEAGARAIAEQLTNFTSLDLSYNQIGDAGARAIAEQLTNLTSLDLSYNQIGDAGARAIAEQLTNLTSLDLWKNQIGEETERQLHEQLKDRIPNLNL